MRKLIIAVLVAILVNGCSDSITGMQGDPGAVLFQNEYINYAWGYNHHGWMMTTTGTAVRFQKKATWVFPDSLGYVSEKDMMNNLFACDSVIAHASPAEATLYAGQALACANGPFSKPEMRMADAGEQIYAFYLYDAAGKRYKRVILEMTGDWFQQNLDPRAAEIVGWMKKIKSN